MPKQKKGPLTPIRILNFRILSGRILKFRRSCGTWEFPQAQAPASRVLTIDKESDIWDLLLGFLLAMQSKAQHIASQDCLFLPQRPYMSLGTLRDQLLYPNAQVTIRAWLHLEVGGPFCAFVVMHTD